MENLHGRAAARADQGRHPRSVNFTLRRKIFLPMPQPPPEGPGKAPKQARAWALPTENAARMQERTPRGTRVRGVCYSLLPAAAARVGCSLPQGLTGIG